MKGNSVPKREIRAKSLFDFSSISGLNEDQNDFFLLSDYYEKKKSIYTLNSIFNFINNKYAKNTKKETKEKNPLKNEKKKENEYMLPTIILAKNKEKSIEKIDNLLKTNKINENNNELLKIDEINILNINSEIQERNSTKRKILINKKLPFSNTILEQAFNLIGVNKNKKESYDDLNQILPNNNTFYFQKKNFNVERNDHSELKNKGNLFFNNIKKNNNDLNNNQKEKDYLKINQKYGNLKYEDDVKPRKIFNLEIERCDNTNNNSIDETDIGVIGLFTKYSQNRKGKINNNLIETKDIYTSRNLQVRGNITHMGNFKSENSVKLKSIEFELIKRARIAKSLKKVKRLDFNFRGSLNKELK